MTLVHKMTLQNFYNEYFDLTITLLSESTVRVKRNFFVKRILPALGEMELIDIKYVHVQKFINTILDEGRAPKTAENILSGLSTLLRLALKLEILEKNPCEFVELPQYDNKKYFTHSEAVQREFLKSILAYDVYMYKDIFLFLFHGRRRGEALNLTWKMVDFEQRIYYIPARINKAKRNMSYKMTDILYDRLMFHYLHECINQNTRFPQGYVFVNPITKTRFKDLRKRWTEFLILNDLPRIVLHDIRHLLGTYTTNVLELPIEKISHTLGHTNVTTTQKYITVRPQSSKQIMDKIFESVGGSVKGV